MMSLSLRSLAIRPVLLADAATTGTAALLMLLGASPLGALLDLPAALLAGTGLALVPYVAFLFWLARHDALPRSGVWLVVVLNIAWAVGCVALLASGQVDPNGLGVAFVLMQVVVVLVFADAQVIAHRANRTAHPGRPLELEV